MSDPDSAPEELAIETDEGLVVAHSTEVADVPQEIIPVNVAESRQFEQWATEAKAFLRTYGKPQSENELKQYDAAFKSWQDSPEKKHSGQDVINILGAYLGQRMVDDFGMEWVMVTDEYGQDYAIRHTDSELMSFPFSSVMKRIEDKEHDFVHGVYHVIKNHIENGEWTERRSSEQDGAPIP